jgi:hypothetical protein
MCLTLCGVGFGSVSGGVGACTGLNVGIMAICLAGASGAGFDSG